jgi:hypothetical protein
VKAVKNVWVRIAHHGSKKNAMIFFTQRAGTVSGIGRPGARRVVGTT